MACYCPKCNAQTSDTARFCSACGAPLDVAGGATPPGDLAPAAPPGNVTPGAVPAGPLGVSPAMPPASATPDAVSGKATASLVLGLLSFLTCILTGVPAIVLGLLAQRDIRRSGGRLGGDGLAIAGIVTGGIGMFLAVPLLGMMVGIAVPGFIKAREKAQANACTEAQYMMDAAVDNWSIDRGKKVGDQPAEADLIGPNMYLRTWPFCPIGPNGPTPIAIPAVGDDAVCPNAIRSHHRQ